MCVCVCMCVYVFVCVCVQGRSYDLDSGQVKIFARVARPKFFGVMNINELIIVNNCVIDRARQVALFRKS